MEVILMPKITFIGAGSLVFTRQLCNDILLTPTLRDCEIVLMDIDPQRLEMATTIVKALIEKHGGKAQVRATLNRREALTETDYVITTFQQGGLEAYKLDIEIPQRYGVGQCVGDTLGPGGVFRSLRTIPVLLDICDELDDLAPDALLLNYVNPMAANCWAIDSGSGRPHVGLCHSVQSTSEDLARWVGIPYEMVQYLCAGINHQAWFLDFRSEDEDLYPKLWYAIEEEGPLAEDPVRIDIMKHFGYFVTESSGHASEYVPYYRKSAEMIENELVPRFSDPRNAWFGLAGTGGYLQHCIERWEKFQEEYEELATGDVHLAEERTHEYGSYIIEAIETDQPARVNGNVPNRRLIENLPEGCCVEVPCLVDANGVQPTHVGYLPPQLAAINRTNINVQELIVEAALSGKVDAVYHAVMLDPLTSAVCTLPQIHEMVTEMLAAQKHWLPQFERK
jgi:alpha-galactosidase